MPSQRNPFPFPKHENDITFSGADDVQLTATFDKPTHLAQNDQPWCRLNDTSTLASTRRSVMHYNKQEFMLSKNQTLYQKETLLQDHDHGRPLKNRVTFEEPTKQMDFKVWMNSQRNSLCSIQGAIESHHNASTNRGYSRKHDGGFYSI
ncbi:protein C1orf194 homolog isoform X4 [Hypomesus transpacificus]|uniref:protein C1orf194 homolog isoform X4 n=1 Tax=Hypomesus transpacificus TaxID=137520 RepID=UPI001F07229F|nr:protein C1orf194 homolog isoform X4 [Hypomesus transpacificus]